MIQFNILLCLLLASLTRAAQLLQVQVVTRHGARSPLTKDASGVVEGGSQLTPVGQKELYDLGAFMRTRYLDKGIINQYNSTFGTFESSRLDRTVVSASSFALGLYPKEARNPYNESLLGADVTPANVPVYTSDWVNDVTIRAYDKCPTFSAKLDALFVSVSWLAYQDAHSALLTKLATSGFSAYADPTTGAVPLKSVWNCFDAINVAKTECSPNPDAKACTDLTDPSVRNVLDDTEWTELQQIAHYAELQKYSIANTGDILGGNLLKLITNRMTGHTKTWDYSFIGPLQKFYMYSGHYPTILSMFGAMGQNYNALSDETIPNYGTALIFELWRDEATDAQTVQTYYKEGMQADVVALALDGACGGVANCPLESFQNRANSLTYDDFAGWCTACGNESANGCLSADLATVKDTLYTTSKELTMCKANSGDDDCTSNGWNFFAFTFLGGSASEVTRFIWQQLQKRGYLDRCSKRKQSSQLNQDENANKRVGLSQL